MANKPTPCRGLTAVVKGENGKTFWFDTEVREEAELVLCRLGFLPQDYTLLPAPDVTGEIHRRVSRVELMKFFPDSTRDLALAALQMLTMIYGDKEAGAPPDKLEAAPGHLYVVRTDDGTILADILEQVENVELPNGPQRVVTTMAGGMTFWDDFCAEVVAGPFKPIW